ncbi:MAG: SurA N-terminal domain-containing protein [Prevotellaceae bacterium]|jgi:peptidyl-prolyl cis-trans isomerase D|nr:SurA N-terminal domain-containing protein [Prevotellaceae bacterium]
MAVLEKIRVRMGVFITVIIGFALISFIVDADTLSSIISVFSSQNDVGEINGKEISYQDFIKRQEYYSQINTLFTGGSSLSEEMQEQINEQVWQDFFREEVLNPQYEKSGMEISAKELVDLTQGRSISPILQRDPVFWGETGVFSRVNVLNFISSINSDPSGMRAAYWKYCEDRMRNAQLLEKYMSLLTQSSRSNSLELKRRVADRNTTVDIGYVAQSINAADDSTVRITEGAARQYYNKHKNRFAQPADERDVELVAFPVEPSDDDIRLAEEAMAKIYNEFTATKTAELGNFVSRNSDVTFSGKYYKRNELSPALDSFAFRAAAKDVLPVYREDNTFYTARIIRSRMMPDSVKARHILIQNVGKEAAGRIADSLINVLGRGANFGYIAQQYSADQAANRNEGDLGWFTQGVMVKAFNDTCFVVPQNRLIKVETTFGTHIVEVTDRSPEERMVQLAIVEKTAHPGKNTYQTIFARANDLATASAGHEQFREAAAEKKLNVVPAWSLREGQKSLAALPGANVRDLMRWVYEVKTGDVSPVLTVGNYFVVASLTAVRNQGMLPFQQVRPEIESILQQEQKVERLAQQMKEAAATVASIDELAEKTGLTVTAATDISFAGSSFITGAGLEPKLQGSAAGAPENTLTGPVKGSLGAYFFTVTRRYTGAAYTLDEEKEREAYMEKYDQMTLMQRYQEFYDVLEKTADVVDHRGRFF